MLTLDKGVNLNFLLRTEDRFLKIQGQVVEQVVAWAGSSSGPRGTTKTKGKKVLKNITKRAENIFKSAKPAIP